MRNLCSMTRGAFLPLIAAVSIAACAGGSVDEQYVACSALGDPSCGSECSCVPVMNHVYWGVCSCPWKPYQSGPAWVDLGEDGVQDAVAGLVWQNMAGPKSFSFEDAVTQCTDRNVDSQPEWRVPTVYELRRLITGCKFTELDGPCILTTACGSTKTCLPPQCGGCQLFQGPGFNGCYVPAEFSAVCGYFWTTTAVAGSLDEVFTVGFSYGNISTIGTKNLEAHVLCVRNAQ